MKKQVKDDTNLAEGLPLALGGTRAQLMLEEAVKSAQERGISQRQIAAELGYKSSVVLSHMASGRAPIPVDRATQIARLLEIDEKRFLLAVLEQRFPDVDFRDLLEMRLTSERTVQKFELAAGCSLAELPSETLRLVEEIVSLRNPRARWCSLQEAEVMELIRRVRPTVSDKGLSEFDLARLEEALRIR